MPEPPRSFDGRILMTGITSIHGWPLWRALVERMPADRLFGIRPPKMSVPRGVNVASACVTDATMLSRIRAEFRPTHVIHAAGICDLDVCEERPAWAAAINTHGTRLIAQTFGDSAYLLYVSTDLVFSGNTPPPGGYAEHHAPDPVSVVGRTFAAAEACLTGRRHSCIVRLGLPLGRSVTGDKGAIDWIASRLSRSRPVTLFHDEYRSCIDCDRISTILLRLLQANVEGLFHCGGPEPVSLYEVGRRVLKTGGYAEGLLKGISRFEERNGPPRVGNIALNSAKLQALLARR
jgi:dTDP-4-dehydrorhamnose reductase